MSLCNLPSISLPAVDFDPIAILLALLAIFGIQLPSLPSIQLPAAFCALD